MGKSFKDFDVCKAFRHKSKEKLLLYLAELYEQKSEFNSIQSILERKKEICIKVGLDPAKPDIAEVINLENQDFNELAFHYQSYFKCNNTFQQMMTDQHLFWNLQRTLNAQMEHTDDEEEMMKKFDRRNKLSKIADETQRRINGYLTEMYKDDEEMKEIAGQTVRRTISLEEYLKRKKEHVQENGQSLSI